MQKTVMLLMAAGLLLAAPAARLRAEGAPPAKPSVLVVTLDTTRADRLGCYGKATGLSPALDAWASRSFLFEHCEAPVPETVPSHVSLFSGWYPNRHGVRKNLEVKVPGSVPLLAESFKSAGYVTGAFVSAFVLLGRYGLGRGFGAYDEAFYDPGKPEVVERRAGDTLAAAAAWLESQKQPWFCWIHLYDPHLPYSPPPPFDKKYAGAPYDGEIAYMDQALGEFFKRMNKGGLLDRSVVVICGDHGEGLGEHGEEAHGIFLYEATTHVPLLLRLPGQAQGKKVSQSVSLVDVAPTLADLCGVAVKGADGLSLAPLLKGEKWSRPPLYLEALTGLYSFGWAPLYALVDPPHKYVLAPRPELYDLEKDPGEKRNALASRPELAKKLDQALKKILAGAPTAKGEAVQLDDEELRSLQSLGYVGGAPGKAGGGFIDPKDGIASRADHEAAMKLMAEKRESEAGALFQKLAQKDPGNPLYAYYLGACHEGTDPEKAMEYYKKSIQLRRDFPQAYVRLLFLYESRGRAKEAYALGQIALQEVQDVTGRIGSLTAWAAFDSGQPKARVLELLDQAKQAGPETGWALRLRGLLALQAGDREGALSCLEAMAKVSAPQEVTMMGSDPRFNALRSDPRFRALVNKAREQLQTAPKPAGP
jgi:arylsulfatase A-like enzyme